VAPRYFLDPFGCVKNQVDAENMMAHLNGAGWEAAQDAGGADLIIVNSCGFIEDAKRESIDAVLEWRALYPGKKILLAGCLAQRYSKDLAESLPEADGFFGTGDISQIASAASAAAGAAAGAPGFAAAGASGSGSAPALQASERPLLSLPGSAYVKISEGCDNNCAYCAIPLIRGPLRCRSVHDILDECKGLLARGVRELCIIGQDIGAYRSGSAGLPELLAAIAGLPGNFWARLLYMHPDHFPLRVLDVIEKDARFLPYFDIPFQHASSAILSAMNRGKCAAGLAGAAGALEAAAEAALATSAEKAAAVTSEAAPSAQGAPAEAYLALAQAIRSRLPGAVIRTTFLVGFPGETDEDFAALLDFQEKLRPDWLGCFAYSREEGTSAYAMKKRVAKKTALARKREIEERQVRITEENMKRFAGQTLDILLEEKFSAGDANANDSSGAADANGGEASGTAGAGKAVAGASASKANSGASTADANGGKAGGTAGAGKAVAVAVAGASKANSGASAADANGDETGGFAEAEELWLGRLYCHAPEVDGAAVVAGGLSGAESAGDMLRCKVVARRGFDLEVRLA